MPLQLSELGDMREYLQQQIGLNYLIRLTLERQPEFPGREAAIENTKEVARLVDRIRLLISPVEERQHYERDLIFPHPSTTSTTNSTHPNLPKEGNNMAEANRSENRSESGRSVSSDYIGTANQHGFKKNNTNLAMVGASSPGSPVTLRFTGERNIEARIPDAQQLLAVCLEYRWINPDQLSTTKVA